MRTHLPDTACRKPGGPCLHTRRLWHALIPLAAFMLVPAAYGLEVDVGGGIYYYGDHLNMTITVPEITEQFAIIYITDASGKISSPIPVPLTGTQTVFPSPLPFDRATYPAGIYTITVEYAGARAVAQFSLVDTGELVIPNWVKAVAAHWLRGDVDTYTYADTFKHMVGALPPDDDTQPYIPTWVAEVTLWWLQDRITDDSYSRMLQYLIEHRIITGVF